MHFNPDLFELIPRSQLDADFGGEYEFEFEFETYWKQIVEYVVSLVCSRCLTRFVVTVVLPRMGRDYLATLMGLLWRCEGLIT